jgi:hypothetical protein
VPKGYVIPLGNVGTGMNSCLYIRSLLCWLTKLFRVRKSVPEWSSVLWARKLEITLTILIPTYVEYSFSRSGRDPLHVVEGIGTYTSAVLNAPFGVTLHHRICVSVTLPNTNSRERRHLGVPRTLGLSKSNLSFVLGINTKQRHFRAFYFKWVPDRESCKALQPLNLKRPGPCMGKVPPTYD